MEFFFSGLIIDIRALVLKITLQVAMDGKEWIDDRGEKFTLFEFIVLSFHGLELSN